MTHWDDIERLVHDRIDGLTSAADEAKLAAILASDPELARRARDLTDVVMGLRSLDREQAPADFTRRVMERVASARGASARGWTWRMAGPALMAAAAIVVTALWIGRGQSPPPTLEASAPAGARADDDGVWSEAPAAAPAPSKKAPLPAPGAAVERKAEDVPPQGESLSDLKFADGAPADAGATDAVLDELARLLRSPGELADSEAADDDVAKNDADERASGSAESPRPPRPRGAERDLAVEEGERAAEAVRVLLLRKASTERNPQGFGLLSSRRQERNVLDELLPRPALGGAGGDKAKAGAAKERATPARAEPRDAVSALANSHADRLRDVELDDAAYARLLDEAIQKGYDAFELDRASLAAGETGDLGDLGERRDGATDSVEKATRTSAMPLRWIPVARPGDAPPKEFKGRSGSATSKAAASSAPRRTIVLLVDD